MELNYFLNNSNKFIFWKDEGKILNEKNKKELYKFYKIKYNELNPYFYHLDPTYNSIINSNKFFYIIIEINNDIILVCYKVIQILKTKQIRIIEQPISFNNNQNNEQIILDICKKNDFIKIVTKNISNKICEEYTNFYHNYNEKRFNGHFFSKHGINKFNKNQNFNIKIFNTELDEQEKLKIIDLRKKWKIGMEENNSVISSANDKDFFKFLKMNSNDNYKIIKIIFYYKDNPIGFIGLTYDNILNICICHYIIHLGRMKFDNIDNDLYIVLKNINDIQTYFMLSLLNKLYNINRIYILGCRPKEKRLLKHKEKVTNGKIIYYFN